MGIYVKGLVFFSVSYFETVSHVTHYIAKNELLIFYLYLKFWEAMFITGMFHCAWLVGLVVIIDSLEGPNVSHQVYLLSGDPALL